VALIDGLRASDLFGKLSDADLERVGGCGRVESIDVGQAVVDQGAEPDGLRVVLEGRVRVSRRQPGAEAIDLAVLGPGESFGEPALFDPAPRTATVTTIEASRFFVLERDTFLALACESPRLLSALLEGIGGRLRAQYDERFAEAVRSESTRAEMEAERHRSLAQLVAGVAHEIGTPLGVIMTAASVLSEDLDGDARVAADLIQANVARADKLVQSFKGIAVSQAIERIETVDLGVLIDETLTLYGPQARTAGLRIEVRDDRAEPKRAWTGNAAHLTQILLNLVANAARYAYPDGDSAYPDGDSAYPDGDSAYPDGDSAYPDGDSGRVEIVLGDAPGPDRPFVLTVRDFGRGIPAEDRNRVFDPFFTTGRARGGTGLGLAIVHNLVTEGLGGTVEIGPSAPGTEVRINFGSAPS